MSYMKTKTTKTKSKKEIVLYGDNPQGCAGWETEMKFRIKTKLGAIGLEHFHGRQNYTLSEERGVTELPELPQVPPPISST